MYAGKITDAATPEKEGGVEVIVPTKSSNTSPVVLFLVVVLGVK